MEILFVALLCIGYWPAAIYFYTKGIRASGHTCAPSAPIAPGVRYKPTELKFVAVPCLECGEPVRMEVRVVRTFSERAKGKPYRADLVDDDMRLHILTNHHKEASSPE